jgi:hypothetical protein
MIEWSLLEKMEKRHFYLFFFFFSISNRQISLKA